MTDTTLTWFDVLEWNGPIPTRARFYRGDELLFEAVSENGCTWRRIVDVEWIEIDVTMSENEQPASIPASRAPTGHSRSE